MTNRTSLPTFSLENPFYAGATVTVFGITPTGQKDPSRIVTLYEDLTGSGTLQNPQQLSSKGKWVVPPYVDEPVVISVQGEGFDDHDTGVIWSGYTWRGAWTSATNYVTNDFVQALAAADNSADIYLAANAHTSGVFATDVTNGNLVRVIRIQDLVDPVSGSFLQKAQNLADLANVATARTNLGLGTAAQANTGTAIGDVVELENVSGSAGLPAVDGSQLTGLSAAPNYQIFTSNGNFDKSTLPAGLDAVVVEVIGGGGGGAGAGTTGSGAYSCGGGGGAGGYSRKRILVSALAASEPVTVGAGGAGGNGAAGSNGGTSSFGTFLSCNGGSTGNFFAGGSGLGARSGGAGGTASGGDINATGESGDYCVRAFGDVAAGGAGGSSYFGGGGQSRTSSGFSNGFAGGAPGAGGGGAANGPNQGSTATGGAGADGIVIVSWNG